MRRETLAFVLWIAFLLAVGSALGNTVAKLPRLETFKLLNVLGLTLDLLGLLVLSEFVVSSEKWRDFVIKWVAGVVLWAHTIIPLGAAAAAATFSSAAPSSARASAFFIALFVYSLVPLFLLDLTVFYPSKFDSADKTQRTRRFGLLLLVTGILVQLVAAFQDLHA